MYDAQFNFHCARFKMVQHERLCRVLVTIIASFKTPKVTGCRMTAREHGNATRFFNFVKVNKNSMK